MARLSVSRDELFSRSPIYWFRDSNELADDDEILVAEGTSLAQALHQGSV